MKFFFLILLFALTQSQNNEVNFNFGGMAPSYSMTCNRSNQTCSSSSSLDTLKASLNGTVVTVNDASNSGQYDNLTTVYIVPRGTSKYIPTIIVLPTSTEDVVQAVNYARTNNMTLSVRCGGHSPDGLSLSQRGLQINFANMKAVTIDPIQKTALVQGGALHKDVLAAGHPFNLAPIGGNIGLMGFSGKTSIAAYGALARQYGLGIDNVISVVLVTWNGTVMNVSQQSNPDLFWGLRGALSNFGVVVTWQIKLHNVSSWYGGDVTYLPSSISSTIAWAAQYINDPYFHFRGIYLPGVWLTQWAYWDPNMTTKQKKNFFAPVNTTLGVVLSNTIGLLDYFDSQTASDDQVLAEAHNLNRAYGTGGGAKNVSSNFFDKFQELCTGLQMTDGDCRFELWGGNISAVNPADSAFFSRHSDWIWTFEPEWANPNDDATWQNKSMTAYETLRAMSGANDDCYPNYVCPDFAVQKCYGTNIDRLRTLKQQYDPNNFFNRNFNIQ